MRRGARNCMAEQPNATLQAPPLPPDALELQKLLAVQSSVYDDPTSTFLATAQHSVRHTESRARLRLRRLENAKEQLSRLDKRERAKVDGACAEIEANSKLLLVMHEDLTHVFTRVRYA